MDYVMEKKIFDYRQSKIDNQVSIESYINECVILAEGKNVISRLQAFNEEEKTSAWEKIKEAFKKFGEFIKKIFGKFFNAVERFVKSNKDWLDKYKSVILNNKFRFEDVEMYDYFTGIKRMINAQIPAFMDYETNMKTVLSSKKSCYEWMAKEIKMDKFTYSEGIDFAEMVRNWFKGGENMVTFTASKLNMSDMFNYCYEYDKMCERIKKDQTTLTNSVNKIIDKISTQAKTVSAADNNKTDTSTSNNTTTTGNNEEPKPVVTNPPENGTDAKSESVVFSNVYGSYITEADGPKLGDSIDKNSDNKESGSGVVMKANQTSGVVGDKEKTAAANADNNINYNGQNSDDINNKNTADVEKVKTTEALNELSEAVTRYKDAAGDVFSAKLAVAEKCYKDFMKVMIAHVDSYINKTKTNDKATSAATDYSGNKSSNNQQQTQNTTNDGGKSDKAETPKANKTESPKAKDDDYDDEDYLTYYNGS